MLGADAGDRDAVFADGYVTRIVSCVKALCEVSNNCSYRRGGEEEGAIKGKDCYEERELLYRKLWMA